MDGLPTSTPPTQPVSGVEPPEATARSRRPPEPEHPPAQWGHIPALDGVRGLAIALVMICHIVGRSTPTIFAERGAVEVARMGWIGVDLFFVLSGFLITGILLDARGAAHYFRNFYVRRTLRIFPLYYGILAAVFIVAPLLFAGVRNYGWFTTIHANQGWFWTYTSNVLIATEGTWSPTGKLGHFWSLAIEEQFYLIWPAFVFLLSPLRLRIACATIVIVALGLRIAIGLGGAPDLGAFTLMPARADTLAAGAWVAVALRTGVSLDDIRRHARWVLPASLLAIAAMFVRHRGLSEADFVVYTAGFTCLALGFAAMLTLALDSPQRQTVFGGIFRNRWLRVLGKYSYAMYCFHPFVQEGLRALGLDVNSVPRLGGSILPGVLSNGVLVVALTFAISYMSWHCFEKHFLRLKDRFTTRAAPASSGRLAQPVVPDARGVAPAEGWAEHAPAAGGN